MDVVGFRNILLGCALACASGSSIAADVHPFNGSNWRVAAINGEATPSSYTISFGGGQVTGRLACNDFGGKLKASEAGLDISQLRATTRTCGGKAEEIEGAGFAMLSQPLRMEWASRDRLMLTNSLGTMTLERLP
jgi:heat shock protein HslJ